MKKIFTLAIAAVALAFCACSKEESVDLNQLVGKWETVKVVMSYAGQTHTENFGEEEGQREFFVFNEDGTGYVTDLDYYSGRWHEDTDYFSYTVNGNRVYIDNMDAQEIRIEKLTSTEMVVALKDTEDGENVDYKAYLIRVE